jgi:hypothetical protein
MSINKKEKTAALRQRSGHVVISSRLVSFLYQLMRDHVPPGIVEELVIESEDEPEITYTNGWLAKYAEDLAGRLKGQEDKNDASRNKRSENH